MQHTLRYFQICDSVDNYGAVLQRARSERAIAEVFRCKYFVCGHLELWVGVFGCARAARRLSEWAAPDIFNELHLHCISWPTNMLRVVLSMAAVCVFACTLF